MFRVNNSLYKEINMKKINSIIAIIILVSMLTAIPVFGAGSASATLVPDSSEDTYGIIYPTSGQINVTYNDPSGLNTITTTNLTFKYSSAAISNINSKNAQGLYAGMDVKDNGNSFYAYSVTSTAPNVKTDIEVNMGHDHYNEAEIVIQGQMTANVNYYMYVSWYDLRNGTTSNSANDFFAVNAELSKKALLEYNVQAYETLRWLYYGPNKGYA